MRKILAIDGNSIMNRAFYGIKLLSNKKGVYTNAIFGFINILLKLQKEHTPYNTVVAFDLPAKTFRHERYPEYKGNRKGMSEELYMQMPIIKEILSYLAIPIIEVEGFEADDILGTISEYTRKSNDICILATGDRDCLQLISDNTFVSLAKNRETILYDTNKMHEDFLYMPSQVTQIKALMGDASDNIPGVKGVGEKTAISLIANYQTLDNIYENIETLETTKRLRELLSIYKDMAYLSLELATINKYVPINKLDDILFNTTKEVDKTSLATIFKELEMFAFFEKLGLSSIDVNVPNEIKEDTPPINLTKEIVINPDLFTIKDVVSKTNIIDFLLIDNVLLINSDKIYKIDTDINQYLNLILSSNVTKRTFNAKQFYHFALDNNIVITDNIFDLELLAYLLSPSTKSYSIKELSLKYLTHITMEEGNELNDILILPHLIEAMLKEIIANKQESILYDIELPLCKVLSSMEHIGFNVDIDGIKEFGENLSKQIDLITKDIYDLAGEEFNIRSTRELGVILFDKIGLKSGKKNKTGYSTNADVLEKLQDSHPIINKVIEYRALTKLQSTYVVGFLKLVGKDNRIHSTFNQTLTRTGRISSTEPNIQNIPIRTELGSQMRRFFTAKDGYVLVDADYSQIELRILASISDDAVMINAFNNDEDIHSTTAMQVFNVDKSEITQELRRRAKAINFGIVYGIGPYSLANDIGVSFKEGKEYIASYLEKYSGVNQYMKDIIIKAKKDNYVTTLFGRIRDVSDINSTNKITRGFGERIALNTPIQGTAADVIKLAMNKVYARLEKEKLDAKLILQVHDELIIECHESIKDTVCSLLKEEMEQAAKLSVKLLVEVNYGLTWYDSK